MNKSRLVITAAYSQQRDWYLQGMIQPILKELAKTIQMNQTTEVIISLPPTRDRVFIIRVKTTHF